MTLENFPTPYARINLKWIKNLNARPRTIKKKALKRGVKAKEARYTMGQRQPLQ